MSDKPTTHNADLANLPRALLPLTEHNRWVVWSWQQRVSKNGAAKWTKPPQQAQDPSRNAKSNDPSTWGSYGDAINRVAGGDADGVGYMLLGSDIGAGDFDHARDAETGSIEPWAEQLADEANGAYIETTVSGAGLRAIGTAHGPEVHRKFTFDRKTGAGLELYRNTARYITVSGLEIGSCTELPSIDNFIDTTFARYGSKPNDCSGLNFNNADQQSSSIDFEDLIANGAPEGQRSEPFQSCVWHLAGKGWSTDQITDELARHPRGIGAKYADRLHAEVTRSFEKWRAHKHTAATGEPASSGTPWPEIRITTGELPRVVNEAEDALLALGREIYQRGGLIVRPAFVKLKPGKDRESESWRLIPVTRPHLVETLTCAARFLRWDARAKNFVPSDAPEKIADTYLARQGSWRLPLLSGIVNTPFLRGDGSLCERPGYDPASGLLFKPDDQVFPPIPLAPSKDDAAQALKLLKEPIATFPFVTEGDRSVALSAFLTALDRRSMVTAPLHAFTAPVAGTGKSLLVDLTSILATGHSLSVIAQGRSEEEIEKRLGAALLAGDGIISIDNCDHELQGSFLCQILSQQKVSVRVLGLSKNVEAPANATVLATGNNLTIGADLTRRALLCSLDAGVERPELRAFKVDAMATVRARRGELVAAGLTILRAWHASEKRDELTRFGGFEDWSHRIRAPLVWLDCADPCATVTKIRENDPKRAALYTVMMQWHDHLGLGERRSVQEIIGRALIIGDFQVALGAVASGRAGLVNNDRLGRWLRQVDSKIVNGFSIVRDGVFMGGYPAWKLIRVS